MSPVTEKLCLQWNNFQQNITDSFNKMRENSDFSDVTLVCEDDYQFEAHRVILSACSPIFMKMLKNNKHSHPMIYMRGLKAKHLKAVIDYIYNGEANVYQEDLEAFLVLTEELKIKGLAEDEDSNECITKFIKPFKNQIKIETKEIPSTSNDTFTNTMTREQIEIYCTNELNCKINSMLEKADDGTKTWRCTVCRKVGTRKSHMRIHIEGKHIEGASFPCEICGKTSRSRNGLANHMLKDHRSK